MTLLLAGIAISMAASGLTMAALEKAFHSPRYAEHHFRKAHPTRATEAEKRRLYALNSLLSVLLIFGAAWLGYGTLFVETPTSPGVIALQATALLVAYDVLYYGLHRWVFHHPKLMRYVHRLHHLAVTPSAQESIYTHPVELVAGLALLLSCTWIVGPVHVVAFTIAFFVYSLLNVIIHSGVAFPRGPLRLLNAPARHHHGHHGVNANRNFGSITPVWDALFRTRT